MDVDGDWRAVVDRDVVFELVGDTRVVGARVAVLDVDGVGFLEGYCFGFLEGYCFGRKQY